MARWTMAAWLLVLLGPSSVRAQAVYEEEPNDTPATATEISGPSTLIGELEAEDQDAYLWTVSDVDATKRWTFELQGLPGVLTVVDVHRLIWAENGVDIAATEKLFTFGSRDGTRPGLVENLFFEPGEYLLGFAKSGGEGPYRLDIRPGDHVTLRASHPHESRNDPTRIGLYEHVTLAAVPTSWLRFEIPEAESGAVWVVRGQTVVGRSLDVALHREGGEELVRVHTDSLGHFQIVDLGLEPGGYLIELSGREGGALRAVHPQKTGARIAGAEVEPNDSWQQANGWNPSSSVSGRSGRAAENDFFAFELPEEVENRVLRLSLEASGSFELCLLDRKGASLQCRQAGGGVELAELVLAPGAYGVRVGRGAADDSYSLRLEIGGEHESGTEAEPNDRRELAAGMGPGSVVTGSFAGAEWDSYRFTVTGDAQLWRIQASGEGVDRIDYLDGSGTPGQSQRFPRGGRARLANLFLLPGNHFVAVHGSDGDYTLRTIPLGSPNPNAEREPNDESGRSLPLAIGQTRTGLLADASDVDIYRFHLPGWDRIRLTVTPPPDGEIRAGLSWETGFNHRSRRSAGLGGELVMDGRFPPGDYELRLYSVEPSEAEYRIELERTPYFECSTDCEPNDMASLASPLPRDLVLAGTLGEWADSDWYRIPPHAEEVDLSMPASRPVWLHDNPRGDGNLLVRVGNELRGRIPAGTEAFLQLRGTGRYELPLEMTPSPPAPLAGSPFEGSVELETEAAEVAAYRRFGQTVRGRLSIESASPVEASLTLEAVASDARWSVELDQHRVEVPAGGRVEIPVEIGVPDDAWARRPVRISARVFDDSGGQITAERTIEVTTGAPPLRPRPHWPVPKALLGGLNVAWSGLGGVRVPFEKEGPTGVTSFGRNFDLLFDGMVADGEALLLGLNEKWVDTTVDLAGDGPVEVIGVGLDPVGMMVLSYPTEFVVQLSTDGERFETVLEDRLEPLAAEQMFVLDRPLWARFGRLRLRSAYGGRQGPTLGEWKVIARATTDLSGGSGLDIADRSRGGNVAWATPEFWGNGMLDDQDPPVEVRLASGQPLQFVLSFQDQRGALIDAFEWAESGKSSEKNRFRSVRLATSLESPVGPWQPAAEWELESDTGASTLRLDDPVWARYVRFTTDAPKEASSRHPPRRIRVIEHAVDEEYRSILGEWGFGRRQAVYELEHPIDLEENYRSAENTSRSTASALELGATAKGAARLGEEVRWYRLVVGSEQNTLAIEVTGQPTVRTVAYLESASGSPIPLRRKEAESLPSRTVLEAVVEPSAAYYLRIEEPPRSVAFLWDTSPSVQPFVPLIYNAVSSYAAGAVPGRDEVNFMPFGGRFLMRDWYGEPYLLQTILNESPREETSSDAEGSIARASEALGKRPGTKAIVLVTDAACPTVPGLWEGLEEVRPRIFAIGVSSAGAFARDPVMEQDRMQIWASVNGGHYHYALTQGGMEVAFDRAAALMRSPAPYSVTVTGRFEEAPGPGTLRVVQAVGSGGAMPAGAVELILDASGSMLKRIEGRRRIEVAKEVLGRAVNEYLPVGTPLALRVFGDREANACRTDLKVSLRPLDPAAASRAIGEVDAMNLAKTPIADSLRRVEQDLAKAEGRRLVVLVTDGEETCGGDPDKVLQELRDRGLEVRVNIVGFAIDDPALAAQFEAWARLGGGRYFDAGDAVSLEASMLEALRIPFHVYDAAGTVVGAGLVGGDPLTLEPGYYRVRVEASTPRVFERVVVVGEEESVLEIDSE